MPQQAGEQQVPKPVSTAASFAFPDVPLPSAAPYRMAASRAQDGVVRLRGHAPDGTTRQRLMRAAGLVPPTDGGDSTVWAAANGAIALASGMPDEGWAGRAHRALRAFALLEAGRLEIVDSRVILEGRAPDETTLTRIATLTEPDWLIAIGIEPAPPRLTLGIEEGRFRTVAGLLPDGLDRALLLDVLPDLPLSPEGGRLIVVAKEIAGPLAPSAAPKPTAAPGALPEAPGTRAPEEGTSAEKPREGGETASAATGSAGATPGATPPASAARADVEPVTPAFYQTASNNVPVSPKTWREILAVLPLAVPRIAAGRVELGPQHIVFDAVMRPGFSAADTRAGLRAALRSATGSAAAIAGAVPASPLASGAAPADEVSAPTDEDTDPAEAPVDASVEAPARFQATWRLVLDLNDEPPAARLGVTFGPNGVALAGILPAGLDPDTALVRAGGARRAGLTSGGSGDPTRWRRLLDLLAALRPAIDRAGGVLESDRIALAGTLHPNQDPAELTSSIKSLAITAGLDPLDLTLDLREPASASAAEQDASNLPRPASPQSAATDSAGSSNQRPARGP